MDESRQRSAPVGYAAEYLILASLRLRMCISPLMFRLNIIPFSPCPRSLPSHKTSHHTFTTSSKEHRQENTPCARAISINVHHSEAYILWGSIFIVTPAKNSTPAAFNPSTNLPTLTIISSARCVWSLLAWHLLPRLCQVSMVR